MPPEQSPSVRIIWASSETSADMLYASSVMIPDPFLWMETATERLIVVSDLEVGRMRENAAVNTRVLSIREAARACGLPDAPLPAPDVLLAALLKQRHCRLPQVPPDFPLHLARKLEERGIRPNPRAPFFPDRAVKTTSEVEAVAEGVELAESGLAQALRILRAAQTDAQGFLQWQSGTLTSERLRGEIDAAIARAGGTASHTIVACGIQGADPHQAGHGPLKAGQPLVIDIFPRVDRTGYHGDLTRTVVKGKPADIVGRAHQAVCAARDAVIEDVRPGTEAARLHEVAETVLVEHGFKTDLSVPRGFFHGTGHGLGLEVHEAPRVSRTSKAVLEPGHVFTVEPGLYYPEWGGVRMEDVVVVTEDGCRNLTAAASRFTLP